MSLASDYAKAVSTPLEFYTKSGASHRRAALVTEEGYLHIPNSWVFDSAEALRLADWIKKTFGEDESDV